jgi:ribosomal protein S18 acetylase RimI-like enzyme
MLAALDNPVWSSLTTVHRAFAREHAGALRFDPEVAPFMAIERPGPVAREALEALVGDATAFMLGPTPMLPAGWALDNLGVILQMICERPIDVPDGAPIALLSGSDRPAILDLAALVYPHYFRPRTSELGRYHGVLGRGRLDAMIGERMAVPGLREISAVCTHPACVGRGLARRLLAYASNEVVARGETPFLHVSPANERALRLYEQNGYRGRIDVPFWSVQRDSAARTE